MIWDEFLRHFRFCDEKDSGLSDEEQERKGPKNRPKHTRKRIHQAKKNFLEKFKTASQSEYFSYLCTVRVSRTSKAMQTTAIGTVANSLPKNKVILLTLLSSKRYILIAELCNIFVIRRWQNKVFFKKMKKKTQISML